MGCEGGADGEPPWNTKKSVAANASTAATAPIITRLFVRPLCAMYPAMDTTSRSDTACDPDGRALHDVEVRALDVAHQPPHPVVPLDVGGPLRRLLQARRHHSRRMQVLRYREDVLVDPRREDRIDPLQHPPTSLVFDEEGLVDQSRAQP